MHGTLIIASTVCTAVASCGVTSVICVPSHADGVATGTFTSVDSHLIGSNSCMLWVSILQYLPRS